MFYFCSLCLGMIANSKGNDIAISMFIVLKLS